MFFFFKQKTAYELRISDWSSDVCSSDLVAVANQQRDAVGALEQLVELLEQRRCGLGHGSGVGAGQAAADPVEAGGDVGRGNGAPSAWAPQEGDDAAPERSPSWGVVDRSSVPVAARRGSGGALSSGERSVGEKCVRPCQSGWAP